MFFSPLIARRSRSANYRSDFCGSPPRDLGRPYRRALFAKKRAQTRRQSTRGSIVRDESAGGEQTPRIIQRAGPAEKCGAIRRLSNSERPGANSAPGEIRIKSAAAGLTSPRKPAERFERQYPPRGRICKQRLARAARYRPHPGGRAGHCATYQYYRVT